MISREISQNRRLRMLASLFIKENNLNEKYKSFRNKLKNIEVDKSDKYHKHKKEFRKMINSYSYMISFIQVSYMYRDFERFVKENGGFKFVKTKIDKNFKYEKECKICENIYNLDKKIEGVFVCGYCKKFLLEDNKK